MSKNFVQSVLLRQASIAAYRIFARAQVLRSGQRIFVNSIPKAGTHLLTSELKRFRHLQSSGLHIETRKVNALAKRQERREAISLDLEKFANLANTVRPGQFFTAHLFWDVRLSSYFLAEDIKSLFMIRDPRDVILSNLYYIKGLRRHYLHRFFAHELRTDDERIRALISGHREDPFIRPLKDVLDAYLPWTTSDGVMTVRFEELVGASGGGDDNSKLATLSSIAQHCGLEMDDIPQIRAHRRRRTATLRNGKIAGWRAELTPGQLDLLESECGEAIEALGYGVA